MEGMKHEYKKNQFERRKRYRLIPLLLAVTENFFQFFHLNYMIVINIAFLKKIKCTITKLFIS